MKHIIHMTQCATVCVFACLPPNVKRKEEYRRHPESKKKELLGEGEW